MKAKTILSILVFFFATVSCTAFEQEKEMILSAAGIEELEADCGAGYLRIVGKPGLDEIKVKATIIIKGIDEDRIDDFIEDKITLSLKKRGSKAVLISKVASFTGVSLFKAKTALINLDVLVPQKIALDIDDGSGAMKLADIAANVTIDDGSGAMEIEDIGGNVSIEDGSGSIELKGVTGDVTIDDGSGSIKLEKIVGNLKIDDNSGEVKVKNVSGDVDIEDSSGDIKVYEVGGSVVVDDGSGGIVIDGVKKDVIIKRAGSGSLDIRNVQGKVKK